MTSQEDVCPKSLALDFFGIMSVGGERAAKNLARNLHCDGITETNSRNGGMGQLSLQMHHYARSAEKSMGDPGREFEGVGSFAVNLGFNAKGRCSKKLAFDIPRFSILLPAGQKCAWPDVIATRIVSIGPQSFSVA